MPIKLPDSYFLGVTLPNPKVYFKTVRSIIDAINNGIVRNRIASVINSTATASASQILTGLITSTSLAATSITLPSALSVSSAAALTKGAWFELAVDNSAGASTVTILASATMTFGTAVLTGGATPTIAAGTVGIFKIYFTSAIAAKVFRIA